MPSSKLFYPSFAVVLLTLCPAGPRTRPVGPAAGGERGAHAGPDPAWMAVVNARIRDGGHRFFPGAGGFRAEVAERGLTARFDDAGARITGPGHEGDHPVTVRAARVGRPGRVEGITGVAPGLGECQEGKVDPVGACIPRLEYAAGGVTEWWEAGPKGLEQGWVVAERPAGDGPLWIDVEVANADAVVQGAQVRLLGDDGDALVVRGLAAQDARGDDVPLRFQGTDDGFRVVVDDEGAEYPIVVDPVYTGEDWSVHGVGGDELGFVVGGAGDTNGDGYDDVLVGSSSATYLFEGSASGVGTSAVATLLVASDGDATGAAGDVNGDGYGDVLVRGRLHVGGAAGLSEAASISLNGDVVPAGDVDGDGYDDVAVGYLCRNGDDEGHYAYCLDVHLGSSGGVVSTAAWTVSEGASYEVVGSAAAAGDVNGDGLGDLILGVLCGEGTAYDPRTGTHRILWVGLAAVYTGRSHAILLGTQDGAYGSAVSGAGDVDGDGYDDVLVGKPPTTDSASDGGRIYVYPGSADGTLTTTMTGFAGESDAVIGDAVSAAGDVNGDGFADVLLGDGVYLGSSSGLDSARVTTLVGTGAGVGDVNGDGYDDVAAGESTYQLPLGDGTDSGAAWVYMGSPGGPVAPSTPVTMQGEHLGAALAAADVDGDGYDDLIIGAYGYDEFRGEAMVYPGGASGLGSTPAVTLFGAEVGDCFGISVAPAGDTNGDRRADVIIGASGAGEYGEAYVYVGSETGISDSPTVTLSGDLVAKSFGRRVSGIGDADADGYDDVAVGAGEESNQVRTFAGSALGTQPGVTRSLGFRSTPTAIAAAGDVNRDGYGDMVVGCEDDSDDGAAFLYLGSATGTAGSAEVTLYGEHGLEMFGHAVAGVGDVDGDGYDDVAVGAPGRAHVYAFRGRSSGLDPAAVSALDGTTGSAFGTWIGGAGDVDGDGFDDVAVASAGDAGVFVYPGSSGGVGGEAVHSATGLAGLGDVVVRADFNGDGLSDVAGGEAASDLYGGDVSAWYGCIDADRDGFCVAEDCDDADPAVQVFFFADADGDGYGNAGAPSASCVLSEGYVVDKSDCNDAEPSVHPAAVEVCNNVDDDCDGHKDEGAVDRFIWYADADGDGHPGDGDPVFACDEPEGYTEPAATADCDDFDLHVYPGAPDPPGDGVDQNCNGLPCGCAATPAGASAAFTLLGALLARRRRSAATAR